MQVAKEKAADNQKPVIQPLFRSIERGSTYLFLAHGTEGEWRAGGWGGTVGDAALLVRNVNWMTRSTPPKGVGMWVVPLVTAPVNK